MQGTHVSTCIAGSLLHSQPSNGQRLTSSTSLGEHRLLRALSGQAPHPAGTSGGALGPLSSADSPQELSEQVWGVLQEGLQPFMHWELQSGMGDFWEQVLPPPPLAPSPPCPPLPLRPCCFRVWIQVSCVPVRHFVNQLAIPKHLSQKPQLQPGMPRFCKAQHHSAH